MFLIIFPACDIPNLVLSFVLSLYCLLMVSLTQCALYIIPVVYDLRCNNNLYRHELLKFSFLLLFFFSFRRTTTPVMQCNRLAQLCLKYTCTTVCNVDSTRRDAGAKLSQTYMRDNSSLCPLANHIYTYLYIGIYKNEVS